MTMTDSPTARSSQAENGHYGLVCVCGGTRWKTTHTRPGYSCLRRWKTCLACRQRIRTVERAESAGHPDHS